MEKSKPNLTPLHELAEGAKFKYPRPTCLTGVYIKGRRVYPSHMDYFYIHEDGVPNDVFVSSEHTEVIPFVEEEQVTEQS